MCEGKMASAMKSSGSGTLTATSLIMHLQERCDILLYFVLVMFDENIITAPGQPSADKLKNIYCGRNYLQEIRGRFLLPSPLQYLLINIIWMKQQHQKLQLGFILFPVFCYSTHNEKLATRCISPSQHYSHPYYVLLSYPCNWEWIIQFLIDTKVFLPSLQFSMNKTANVWKTKWNQMLDNITWREWSECHFVYKCWTKPAFTVNKSKFRMQWFWFLTFLKVLFGVDLELGDKTLIKCKVDREGFELWKEL